MPRLNFPAGFSLLLGVALLGGMAPASALARDVLAGVDLDLSAGYRVDQLDWNIAGNTAGTNPDILSELTWDDLESYQVTARGRIIMSNRRSPVAGMIRGSISYGEIYSGSNQDSDYSGDGRTREFSRSNNGADDGDLWDGSLGGGVVFFSRDRKFSLTPAAGFSVHKQNLTIHDGYQTLSEPANAPPLPPGVSLPPVGPVDGLYSTYETEWRSGWLGLDLNYQPTPAFELHGTVEFHAGDYEASADWNLRSDLQHPESFRHNSDDAYGYVANFGMRAGRQLLFLTLDFYYQNWQADDGLSYTYFSDGTSGVTKLNEVNWEAASVNAGLTVRF
jgi:hypothetical protein